MDIVAEFRRLVPLTDVPGLQNVWMFAGPARRARRFYLPRPDGQALFQVNAKVATDEEEIRRFLRFAQRHMADLANAAPMAAVGGLRLERYACDSAVSVLPSAAGLTPTVGKAPEVDSRVYGLFPGWQCEVSTTESESAAFYRYRKVLDYSNWERDPQPYLTAVYSYKDAGAPVVDREEAVTVEMDEALSLAQRVREAESGRVVWTNYSGREIRLVLDERLGLIWDSGGSDVPIAPEELRARLWSFATTGR